MYFSFGCGCSWPGAWDAKLFLQLLLLLPLVFLEQSLLLLLILMLLLLLLLLPLPSNCDRIGGVPLRLSLIRTYKSLERYKSLEPYEVLETYKYVVIKPYGASYTSCGLIWSYGHLTGHVVLQEPIEVPVRLWPPCGAKPPGISDLSWNKAQWRDPSKFPF